MAQKVSKLEQAQLAEKPWQLTGEVTSTKRPLNSLLEADLEFDQATKLTPVVTEEVTASIDEIIKGRVKDQLWDDVIRIAALEPTRFRPKAAELSTDKSKLGLGEEYAQEYEQKVLGAASEGDSATTKAHAEVRALLAKLGSRLDALFNFHSVPRPHKPEATVRAAVSTVSLEEAMPTAMADHEALAPEEVYGKRTGVKQLADRSELSQQERQALRKRKKRVRKRQTAEVTEREALQAKLNPDGAAAKRIEARKVDAALADAKRKGTVLTGTAAAQASTERSGREFTKSAKFFATMQGNAAAAQSPGKGGAGRKRPRADADLGGDSASKAAKYKL